MISKQEVEHIASLARLELTEKETEKLQKDMSSILDYFNLLQKAPNLDAKTEFSGLSSLRKDEAAAANANFSESLISAAPNKKDNYIKVKTILQ
mgnify:CR=1 FL=1